jgi:hypothetical protein
MNKFVIITGLLIAFTDLSKAEVIPSWFVKAFNEQKLNQKYSIINNVKPTFLNADLNGDGKEDIAVQIVNIKTKKKGLLIINAVTNKSFIFGAGIKFKEEDFDNTNWLHGWRINKDKIVYEARFNSDGDMMAARKIRIKHPAIYAYSLEDGEESAGVIIYWNGANYISIHQGE